MSLGRQYSLDYAERFRYFVVSRPIANNIPDVQLRSLKLSILNISFFLEQTSKVVNFKPVLEGF